MSGAGPELSIIVPSYEGEAHLGRCLDSLLTQEDVVTELIVVDDGSHDRSVDIARSYEVRVIRRPHQGVAAARNTGLRAASAPVIGFCDQDDEWTPRKASRQLAFLRERPDVAAVLCRQELVFAPGVERPAWLVPDARGDLGGVQPVSGLFRADVLASVDGFDETLEAGDDLDLLVRLRESGHDIVVIDDRLVVRHVHEHNASNQYESYAPSIFEVYRRRARRSRR